jgi:hypothetical protein
MLQTTSYQPDFYTRSPEKCQEQGRNLAEFLCSLEIETVDDAWNESFLV